jgi:Bacterial regulatory proteins, lacI family/Periplasmic binding proteins and sugar binding domain of LacI family
VFRSVASALMCLSNHCAREEFLYDHQPPTRATQSGHARGGLGRTLDASRPVTILIRRHLGTIKGRPMKNAILIVGILLFVVGSTGSVLLDIPKRRNLRATPTRHRRRHRWGGPYYGGGSGWGNDGREQSRDDWGSGTWGDSVVARAGVSKSSVSRVLRGSPLVSEEARAAVLHAIEELGYRPNAAARTLVGRQSNAIGVLVSDLYNPFFPMVLDGIDAVAEEHGYTSLIVMGKRRSQTEEHALGQLLERQVDGIVAVTERLSPEALVEAARSTPLAALTRTPRIPEAMQSVLARLKRRDRPAHHVMVPPRLIERATTAPPRGVVARP